MKKNTEVQIRLWTFLISVPILFLTIANLFTGATGGAGFVMLIITIGLCYWALKVLWRVWFGPDK